MNTWPLLIPMALSVGWYWGRRRSKNYAAKSRTFSRSYYQGLHYLLDEQHDKAVDVFLKFLEVDSDTVEMHLALGSLFRRRGEVDRAIRIHQNLIVRPQLSGEQRGAALFELGQDYLSAGVYDRAEGIFQEIVELNGEESLAALRALLYIFQREKAWLKAIKVAQVLAQRTGQSMQSVIAHYYCELSEVYLQQDKLHDAITYLQKAERADGQAVRASLLQGRIAQQQGDYRLAIQAYQRVQQQAPAFLSEAVSPMVMCYQKLEQLRPCIDVLHKLVEEHPRISIILALAECLYDAEGPDVAIDFLTEQLTQHPSIRGLTKLISWHLYAATGKVRNKLEVLQDLTVRLLANKPVYGCLKCGFSGKTLHWQCPSCHEWNSVQPIQGVEGE